MRKRFVGKTVGVTGAGRGIGQAIALRFANEGANVVVMDIGQTGETSNLCQSAGAEVLEINFDIRYGEEIKKAVQEVKACFGDADIWVNNAGIFDDTPLSDISETLWDRISDINYKSMMLCVQAVSPGMLAKTWGRIINMSSMSGKIAYPNEAAYCSTKAAVLGLTRALAVELGPDGVTVNAICPGPIATAMLKEANQSLANQLKVSVEEWEARVIETIPVGRFGEPAEIAALVAFLASEEAGFINGQAINIDGGMVFY